MIGICDMNRLRSAHLAAVLRHHNAATKVLQTSGMPVQCVILLWRRRAPTPLATFRARSDLVLCDV
jgi:hypothetical protein